MTEKLKVELKIAKKYLRDEDINPLNNRLSVCIMKHLNSLVDVIHKLDLVELKLSLYELLKVIIISAFGILKIKFLFLIYPKRIKF